MPLLWDAAEQADALPPHHKDPMDRMLVAAALERGLTIMTDDAVFPAYGVVKPASNVIGGVRQHKSSVPDTGLPGAPRMGSILDAHGPK